MADCYTFSDIAEAVSCSDADNVAGTTSEIEVGYADDVAVWPDKPSAEGSAMTFAAAGTLTGNLTVKKGAARCKVVFTRNTGEFTMTEQGEAGGENVLYSVTLERAKMTAEIFGFLNATRGRRLWAKVTDKNGNKYLLGDAINQAYRVPADAVTTGKESSSVNKVPIKIEYVASRNLVWTGDVEEANS